MAPRSTVCIAIDGEAAAGKSTLGELLAEKLGYLYFDTGVMYRAVTWMALQRGVDVADETAVTALAKGLRIQVVPPTCQDGRPYTVFADGEDVTWAIREPDVDGAVSDVAAYPGVRHTLREQQRAIGLAQDVVMVGRDIGTAVMPDADLKIFMRASVDERARRRHAELRARGEQVAYAEVLASMQQRDHTDSHRTIHPLRAAPDSVIVETDKVSADEVLARVLVIVRECLPLTESMPPEGTRTSDYHRHAL
jgi:cytidylate kinase